jgi:hypothetical protein
MNLHLAIDQKFIKAFKERQEQFSDTPNYYIIFTDQKEFMNNNGGIEYLPLDRECFERILQKQSSINTIYFHGLTNFFQDLIIELKLWEKYNLTWIFYGGEVFGSYKLLSTFLMPKSKEAHKRMYPEYYFKPCLNPIQFRRNILNFKFYRNKLKAETTRMESVVRKN